MVRRFLFSGCLFWLGALTLSAKVYTFDALDCRCEVPDSWLGRDVRTDLVNASDSTHHKGFALRVFRADPEITIAPATFERRLAADLALHGFNLKDQTTVNLSGLDFLKMEMGKDLGNRKLNTSFYFANANGFTYRMEVSEYNDSPDDDTELQGIVNSFAFVRPPRPDVQVSPLIRIMNPPGAHPPGFLIAYYAILGLIATAFMVVVGSVVGGIGFIIYLLVRPRRGGPTG